MENRIKTIEKGKIIPLKYDFMFTEIFNKEENIEIVESFISNYLEIPLEEVRNKIKIKSRRIGKENKKEKDNEVDLLLEMKKEKINIEISNGITQGIKDRNVVYISKVHGKNMIYADDYTDIGKTIQINLVSKKINEEEMIESYYLRNERGHKLTDKLQIDYVDMEKAIKKCYNEKKRERKIVKWCRLIMEEDKERFQEELREIEDMSEKAKEKLKEDVERLSEDEERVELYTKLSKHEMEHNTIIADCKREVEEARREAKEEAKKEVEKEVKKETEAIAKNMIKEKYDIKEISKLTRLSIEEIEKLMP